MCPIVVSLKSVRFVVSAALLAAVVIAFAPAAYAQAKFTGVGDVQGGPFYSIVRDATRVGSSIYAVGGSAARDQILCVYNPQDPNAPPTPSNCNVNSYVPDTAMLWLWSGTNPPSPTALPDLAVNTNPNAVGPIFAAAIAADGANIASRARSNTSNNQRQAVRVTTSLVPSSSANQNLASRFAPALNPSTAATSISVDGSILYGFSGGNALRFDAVGATSTIIAPPSPWGGIGPAARGTSADGSVMVGSMTNGNAFYSGQAFRYVYGSGLTTIPLLNGGTWNGAVAVSSAGNLVLVDGNSSAYPNGEVYLYDATGTPAPTSTPLGSPNSAWSPGNVAGMTPSGSVVAVVLLRPEQRVRLLPQQSRLVPGCERPRRERDRCQSPGLD